MSDFLQSMAELSAERAAAAGAISESGLDRPVVPLKLGAFDIIAEIKNRSPAEGQLAASPAGLGERMAARERMSADDVPFVER